MKVPRSIQWKITGVVMLFGCVMILLNNWRDQKWLAEQKLENLEREAADTGSRLSGVLQHLSRRQQERAADLEMSYVSLSPDVELGVVCGGDGLVRCSTQLQWRGIPVGGTPLAAEWSRAAAVMERMTALLTWDETRTKLIIAAPFYEGYNTRDRAVALIRYDPALSLAQVREDAWHESLRHACVLLALTLLLWFAFDEAVGRRVRELLHQVRAVGMGDREPAPLAGKDELSAISQEFVNAVRRMRTAEKLSLDASEQERRRIGRDLHDDLCQRLSATKMKTEVMLNLAARDAEGAGNLAQEVVRELHGAVVIGRSMARGLSPVGLDEHGLTEAFEDLARFTRGAFHISCVVEVDAKVNETLTVAERELLFRVTQELVANACKHSRPARMSINASVERGDVVLTVIHDGSPFLEPAPENTPGMGLALMRQRLLALRATLERTVESDFAISTVSFPCNIS